MNRSSLWERIGGWRPVLLAVVGASVGSWGITRLLNGASAAAERLPQASPLHPPSAYAEHVYGGLVTPDVPVTSVVVGQLTPSGSRVFDPQHPYAQLAALQARTWLFLLVATALLALAVASAVWLRGRTRPLAIAATGIGSGVFAAFAVAINTLTGAWDEVFVFASQASSLAAGHRPGVPVTGPIGIAESSADALATHLGGFLLAVFPGLAPTTALVAGYLVGAWAVLAAAVFLATRWFSVSPVVGTIAASLLVMLFPENLSALASGVPLVLASSGLVLLSLGFARAYVCSRPWALVPIGVVAAWIRWEYGLLTIGALLLLFALTWRKQGLAKARQGLAGPMIIFGGVMVVVALGRQAAFGAWIPSGVRAKAAGLDGGYLHDGIEYLQRLRALTSWDVLLALLLVAFLLVPRVRRFAWPLALVILPAATGIAAGGDWFPDTWARYLVPSLAAAGFLIVLACTRDTRSRNAGAPTDAIGPRRWPVRNSLGLAAALGVLVGSAPVVATVLTDLSRPAAQRQGIGRTDCLAAAGELLRLALPAGMGVATAEVNTLAFFAHQPLTDLSGLVDPRTASAPMAPLQPGDVMHRRANRELIRNDRPAVIYLFEGVSCGGAPRSSPVLGAAWTALLNREITRFRAGPPQELLVSYEPATLEGPAVQVNVLMRKDLLPELRRIGTFDYSRRVT
jgi:hypothetical protein